MNIRPREVAPAATWLRARQAPQNANSIAPSTAQQRRQLAMQAQAMPELEKLKYVQEMDARLKLGHAVNDAELSLAYHLAERDPAVRRLLGPNFNLATSAAVQPGLLGVTPLESNPLLAALWDTSDKTHYADASQVPASQPTRWALAAPRLNETQAEYAERTRETTKFAAPTNVREIDASLAHHKAALVGEAERVARVLKERAAVSTLPRQLGVVSDRFERAVRANLPGGPGAAGRPAVPANWPDGVSYPPTDREVAAARAELEHLKREGYPLDEDEWRRRAEAAGIVHSMPGTPEAARAQAFIDRTRPLTEREWQGHKQKVDQLASVLRERLERTDEMKRVRGIEPQLAAARADELQLRQPDPAWNTGPKETREAEMQLQREAIVRAQAAEDAREAAALAESLEAVETAREAGRALAEAVARGDVKAARAARDARAQAVTDARRANARAITGFTESAASAAALAEVGKSIAVRARVAEQRKKELEWRSPEGLTIDEVRGEANRAAGEARLAKKAARTLAIEEAKAARRARADAVDAETEAEVEALEKARAQREAEELAREARELLRADVDQLSARAEEAERALQEVREALAARDAAIRVAPEVIPPQVLLGEPQPGVAPIVAPEVAQAAAPEVADPAVQRVAEVQLAAQPAMIGAVEAHAAQAQQQVMIDAVGAHAAQGQDDDDVIGFLEKPVAREEEIVREEEIARKKEKPFARRHFTDIRKGEPLFAIVRGRMMANRPDLVTLSNGRETAEEGRNQLWPPGSIDFGKETKEVYKHFDVQSKRR